ncbi:spore germination protein [Brevibacillus brevis]|uniref:spore germination protein n=1 Tax=Brevibacillus brevis TaxID=1393 RepID=UPI003AF4CDBA|nr:spore germination protein [Brevibacillus brevis]
MKRANNEPENEKVVRGPHEGFIEDINLNLQMVRKRIASRQLVIRYYKLGTDTKSRTALVYLQNIANPKLIQEADKRIRSISADNVAYLGMVDENLESKSYSPFPQLLTTERPERVVNNLMEGRVA